MNSYLCDFIFSQNWQEQVIIDAFKMMQFIFEGQLKNLPIQYTGY